MCRTLISSSVPVMVVLLGLLTSLALTASDSSDCVKYPDICNDTQCCLMMAESEEGRCAALLLENQVCEMRPRVMNKTGDAVFLNICPCYPLFGCAGSESSCICQSYFNLTVPDFDDPSD